VDRDGRPVRASLALMPTRDRVVEIPIVALVMSNNDGSFTIDVPPGEYVIQAETSEAFGTAQVVSSADSAVRHEVVVLPTAFLTGRFIFEGGVADRSILKQMRLEFQPAELGKTSAFQRPPVQTAVGEDGRFAVSSIRGAFGLNFSTPWPWQVVRVTRQGRDIIDELIDSRAGDLHDIEVILEPRATRVVATVDDPQRSATDSAFVVIVPEDSRRLGYPSRYIRVARPNSRGEATFNFVPPGSYRVVALKELPAAEWMTTEHLQSLAASGQRFVVNLGDALTISVRAGKLP
jgi:hypothetical protein